MVGVRVGHDRTRLIRRLVQDEHIETQLGLVRALRRHGEDVVLGELARVRTRLTNLDADERAAVEAALRGVAAKLLHDPIVGLKERGAIAEGYHATAVGVNCSTGPEPMVGIVRRMAELSNLVISVQPNAGLPCIKDGRTHFPMDATQLEPYISRFIEAGAGIIGGCCGTTPEYIRRAKQRVTGEAGFRRPRSEGRVLVSSLSQSVRMGGNHPFVAIGAKMNPSGRKKLSESLKKLAYLWWWRLFLRRSPILRWVLKLITSMSLSP